MIVLAAMEIRGKCQAGNITVASLRGCWMPRQPLSDPIAHQWLAHRQLREYLPANESGAISAAQENGRSFTCN
jgi:hypothetical protein